MDMIFILFSDVHNYLHLCEVIVREVIKNSKVTAAEEVLFRGLGKRPGGETSQ